METEESTSEAQESSVATEPAQPSAAPERDSLSNKEAIRVAIAKDRAAEPVAAPAAGAEPTKAETKEAVDDPDMQPPQEFSKEAKEAWKNKDYKRVNQEYRRLSASRLQEMTRAQNRAEQLERESKPMRDLVDKVKSYFTTRGDDAPDEVKIAQALQLVDALKKETPQNRRAALAQAGIDVDGDGSTAAPTTDAAVKALLEHPEIKTLLTFKTDLQESQKQQQLDQVRGLFSDSISKLAAMKTRTGEPVYPGFQDSSEAGIEFARELGSVTRDPTFIKLVLRRIPDATHADLVREAYIQMGGKVSGEPVKVSTSNQQEIERKRRAASSTPGRPVTSRASDARLGKLSRREAIRAAVELDRGGH